MRKEGMGALLRERGPEGLKGLLTKALEGRVFDAVLIPLKAPGGHYAHVLVQDPKLMDSADPLPPVQTTVGGKALSDITRQGNEGLRTVAVMRPCEARGAIELAKLGQIDLTGITLISMDCPGVHPLNESIKEMGRGDVRWVSWESPGDRRICQMCDPPTTPIGDLHLGWIGDDTVLFPTNEKGKGAMDLLGLSQDTPIDGWKLKAEQHASTTNKAREKGLGELHELTNGLDDLMKVLGTCINCHNCMRVCPVCYCRVCAFDLRREGHTSDEVFELARARGGLRLPLDMLMFHLGRMNHMSLNCVSCGACGDACPAGIPIDQIFAMVGDRTRAVFDYQSGLDVNERPPMITYMEQELEGDHE